MRVPGIRRTRVDGAAVLRRLPRRAGVDLGRGVEDAADAPPRPSAQAGRRSVAQMARPAGRAVLWLCIGVVLVRGLGDVFGGSGAPARRAPHDVPGRWPDDRARAFAVEFAHAYLSWQPGLKRWRRQHLTGLVVADQQLRDRITGDPAPRRQVGESVTQATVAATRRLSSERALVTVACVLSGGNGVRLLVVPVARDGQGGLGVFAPPSFGSVRVAARVAAARPASLAGGEAGELSRLSKTFLAAYLSADLEQLSYVVAPGARIGLSGGLALVEVTGVGQVGPSAGERRRLMVQARVRDRANGAVYAATFWLDVVRRGRWYVTGMAGSESR